MLQLVDLLFIILGLMFLWHLLLYRLLPFLSGMLSSESGASFHLVLVTLLPVALVFYRIYEKYGKTEATIGLVASFLLVFFSVSYIRRAFDNIVLHPVANILYNLVYTVILVHFFQDLLKAG